MSEKKSWEDRLVTIGSYLSNNKYLGSIKDALIEFMPMTIIGSISVLWSNVIVNEKTGVGAFWKPIMNLSFLNPMFNAINFATIGCIALIVAFLVGKKLASRYNFNDTFGGALGVVGYISVLNTNFTAGDSSVSGVFSDALGSNGLFTAIIMSIVTVELFAALYKIDAIKIKLPDQVPPQISASFAYMIPAFIDLLIIGVVCLVLHMATGLYLNEVIVTLIQRPLVHVGGSLPGMLLFQLIILSLWSVGLHGDNMIGGVLTPIVTAMTLENMTNISNGVAATNVFTTGFNRAFFATGGTGMVLGLTLAMLIKAKRPENRSISKMAIIPNLFNIGEIDMFGYPVVLSPSLMIPFILCPLITGTFGYIMTAIGFCPIFAYDVPWTMPPFLIAFVATGGSIRAIITQVIAIALSVLVYLPFIGTFERSQAVEQEKQ